MNPALARDWAIQRPTPPHLWRFQQIPKLRLSMVKLKKQTRGLKCSNQTEAAAFWVYPKKGQKATAPSLSSELTQGHREKMKGQAKDQAKDVATPQDTGTQKKGGLAVFARTNGSLKKAHTHILFRMAARVVFAGTWPHSW